MNDVKEKQTRTRTPKQLTAQEIMTHLEKLPLKDQLTVLHDLRGLIDDRKKSLQEDIELINGGGR
jgi:hypothetical protein